MQSQLQPWHEFGTALSVCLSSGGQGKCLEKHFFYLFGDSSGTEITNFNWNKSVYRQLTECC